MGDLPIGEQRARAGLDRKGRDVRRGPPVPPDTARVRALDGTVTAIHTVGEEERVDLPEAEVEERRARFDADRRARANQRKASRASMPLWMRLEQVTNALGRLQAPRARAISSTPGDGADRVLPPGGNELEVAHAHAGEVERRLRDVEKAVERIEELLDAHHGLAPARDFALMDSYDKNRVILEEFVGWAPEEIAAFEPALGKPRTIRWVREDWADDPKNGDWGKRRGVCGHRPEACECPGVRKPPRKKAA